MRVTRSIIINAPVEEVWKVAARDFDKVDRWASGVSSSGIAQGDLPSDEADMAGRVCMTSFGKCYEMFEVFDEENHTFTYAAHFEKTPPGVKSAFNTWSVEAVSSSQSRLMMSAKADFNLFPGSFLRIPMRLQIPRILDMNLEEIKHYIETGNPHPRKLEAISQQVA